MDLQALWVCWNPGIEAWLGLLAGCLAGFLGLLDCFARWLAGSFSVLLTRRLSGLTGLLGLLTGWAYCLDRISGWVGFLACWACCLAGFASWIDWPAGWDWMLDGPLTECLGLLSDSLGLLCGWAC
jgi:hypothetical protein